MFSMRMGMGLGAGTSAAMEQVATPVIAVGLDADPTGEYTSEQTIAFGGANDITCATDGATILVRYSTDDGANWSEWTEWVAEV
jgi:hypothetical protein